MKTTTNPPDKHTNKVLSKKPLFVRRFRRFRRLSAALEPPDRRRQSAESAQSADITPRATPASLPPSLFIAKKPAAAFHADAPPFPRFAPPRKPSPPSEKWSVGSTRRNLLASQATAPTKHTPHQPEKGTKIPSRTPATSLTIDAASIAKNAASLFFDTTDADLKKDATIYKKDFAFIKKDDTSKKRDAALNDRAVAALIYAKCLQKISSATTRRGFATTLAGDTIR